jgi:ABC-2 type transport system ATP-binding protein
MLAMKELTKRYGETVALNRLSLSLPQGSVFGLLGPNGAGKTTLLRLLMGFVFPDDGEIDLGGLSPTQIGFLPERAFYPPRFSIRDYLGTIGKLAGLQRNGLQAEVDQRLAQLSLDQVARRRLGACSRGMLQRVGLAQALLGDPQLLLLDEPALGLDPAGQRFMREQIRSLHRSGKTVLLSSHHLDEVTRVCTDVAVLQQGQLVRNGPLDDFLAPHTQVIIRTSSLAAELSARLAELGPDITVEADLVSLSGEAVSRKAEVLRLLLDAQADIQQLDQQHSTLEEVYLEATGE